MNKKGQALIEFILIMPLLLIILMSLIDVGNIFLNKYELGKDLETIEQLYQKGDKKELLAYAANEDITFEEEGQNDMVTLKVKKQVNITAPMLTNILGKKYTIEDSKTIYGEENNGEENEQ